MLPAAKPCSLYKADAFTLSTINSKADHKQDHLQKLAESIAEFTIPELAVLAGIFLAEKKTRQQGFRFWQRVYVRIRGTSSDNYLNNFVVGRVLDADKEYVRVVSDLGKSCIQVVNDKNSCTLYTHARFDGMRAEMRRDKKLVDPATSRNLKKSATSNMETVDFAVDSGLIDTEFGFKNPKVRKSKYLDLVGIVKKMNTGRIASRNEKYSGYDNDDLSEISIHHR